jgi:hypothetical protein
MGLAPSLPERSMEPLAEGDWQVVRFAFLVERDGLADVVHNHLAGIAPGHVFLELRSTS